jgi:hypothetical protein
LKESIEIKKINRSSFSESLQRPGLPTHWHFLFVRLNVVNKTFSCFLSFFTVAFSIETWRNLFFSDNQKRKHFALE